MLIFNPNRRVLNSGYSLSLAGSKLGFKQFWEIWFFGVSIFNPWGRVLDSGYCLNFTGSAPP